MSASRAAPVPRVGWAQARCTLPMCQVFPSVSLRARQMITAEAVVASKSRIRPSWRDDPFRHCTPSTVPELWHCKLGCSARAFRTEEEFKITQAVGSRPQWGQDRIERLVQSLPAARAPFKTYEPPNARSRPRTQWGVHTGTLLSLYDHNERSGRVPLNAQRLPSSRDLPKHPKQRHRKCASCSRDPSQLTPLSTLGTGHIPERS